LEMSVKYQTTPLCGINPMTSRLWPVTSLAAEFRNATWEMCLSAP